MISHWLIFLLIFFSASPIQKIEMSKPYLIVWNVGQGQWITGVDSDECLHFDVGGEFFPWKKVSKLCSKNKNKIFLSHWDWDHIGGLARWPKWSSCMSVPPVEDLKIKNNKKKLIVKRIQSCPEKLSDNKVSKWTPPLDSKDSNSNSHIFLFREFLIPGDSPKKLENLWRFKREFQKTKILILGHHGSNTSTSPQLLKSLPHLKMAIASARWKRYHHPHPEVISQLKTNHISLLRTEDWGNIWFEL